MDGTATAPDSTEASPVVPLLQASLTRLVRDGLRHPPSPLSARSFRTLLGALRCGAVDVALRHLDRAWRCRPEEASTLAPIYGRLLLLEGGDPGAALHLLRRAGEFAPDPDGAALIAWAQRHGRPAEARAQLSSALAAYAVVPGGLLSVVAGSLMRLWGDVPGWVARGPDLQLVGELADDDPASWRRLRAGYARRDPGAALEARIRGIPLLGCGAQPPAHFGLDGRLQYHARKLAGWARLDWAPGQPLQLTIDDERGNRARTRTRCGRRLAAGGSFEVDLDRVGCSGHRLSVAARLPDGRWQPLPESPLLLDAAVTARPGRTPQLPAWGAKAARPRPRVVGVRAPVDIIIPVYRDREATLACIRSVLDTVGDAAAVVVVDDATDDAALAGALDALAAAGRITLLRHADNRGFVAAVNRGMALNPLHDAVLLNADTRVYADWLTRLRDAAYSDPHVGTVTPWSNSGSIASYPDVQESRIDPVEGQALHALAAATHSQVRVPIPVGVGFCLYVRRDCLTDVGVLDAGVFGKGYGEETDFCVRAGRRGWSHLLAADVFVYHAGALSFGGRREALLERSGRLLNIRHPGYDRHIGEFLAADPLRLLRRRLDERRLLAYAGSVTLLVTHALSGGVDQFVIERSRQLRAQGVLPLVLKPAAPGDSRRCRLSSEALELPNLRYDVASDLESLGALLGGLRLAAVEIQHFLHLDARVIEVVRALPVPYDVVVHDYAWLCPRITLIDGSGRYCGEPALAACERCLRREGSNLGETLSVAGLRARSGTWLRGARRVIAPSFDTAARLRRHFPQLTVEEQSHARPPSPATQAAVLTRASPRPLLRIAVIGAIGVHKGYRVLLDCAQDARARRLPLEFVVVGHTEDDAPLLATGRVFVTGRYTEGEVLHLLRREQPDAIWLPSVWPETWCYALDHALITGLPVAAFDLGAIAERLRAAGRGELMSLALDASCINERLLRLAAHRGISAATASRSATLTLAPPTDDVTMDLTKHRGTTMTNSSDPHAAVPAHETGLSASVQVLPLESGLYLFSVTATGRSAAPLGGRLQLPAMHVGLGPGVSADRVQFMSGPATQDAWLFAATDQLVVKVGMAGATLILTSVRGPDGDTLSIKVERLRPGADVAAPLVAATHLQIPQPAPEPSPPLHITAHVRTRGDMNFAAGGWAGRVAPGLWIESFSVRPLELFSAQDLEYKGLTGSGFETPWISDDKPCGTQGMAVPLVGFALRFKATPAGVGHDCEYSGYFQSGLTVGPLRNGAPCRSTVADDPLEGIHVRLVKRADRAVTTHAAAVEALHEPATAVPESAVPRRAARPATRHANRNA
jgi:GT2 family glycosyltransferase